MLDFWSSFRKKNKKMVNPLARPSMMWLLSEPSRALLEYGFTYSTASLLKNFKKGDGHPVVVLPGFMGNENSTLLLRDFLKELGYEVHDWGMGRNLGKVEYLELLIERIDSIYEKSGQAISLVGWSLGGVFARQVAKERPDIIRQVITLGSPFGGLADPNNAAWLYSIISGGKKVKHVNQTFLEDLPHPAPVPTTAIYSKSDGVVPWEKCMELVEDSEHQNIQVRGSHLGLGVNLSVLSIIADRLTLTKSNWSRLFRKGIFKNKLIYPSL